MMKKLRMTIDIAMTVVLIGLMAYSLIGELTHEILGTGHLFLHGLHGDYGTARFVRTLPWKSIKVV